MEKQDAGGQIVLRLMNRWLDIKIVSGAPTDEVGGVDGGVEVGGVEVGGVPDVGG